MKRHKHKFVFTVRPGIPSDRLVPIVDGLKWRIVSRTRTNRRGEPMCIGLMVYQPSRNWYKVFCFDAECISLVANTR
jgi:hypothetical protein